MLAILKAYLDASYNLADTFAEQEPLSAEEVQKIHAYWRACNYLAIGMIYLRENPLLKEPLKPEHIKYRLLGHWGASPALSFTYVHLNRLIKKYDLDMIFMAGPGHGAPGVLGPVYLEGTYSEIYPDKSEDEEGLQKFFRQFSFPGHIGSHVTPETPGSIHEGGELGYSVAHAYGSVFDNPDLITAVVVGDGEAETGPLATAWHSNKFLNPIRDGAVLPILNLNGYKIPNPTILARISAHELESLFIGYGYTPYVVECKQDDDLLQCHQKMAATLEHCINQIRDYQAVARNTGVAKRYPWPMIILRSPKGWTGPKEVDGRKVEGFWRAHQVPMGEMHSNPSHRVLLEEWMKSYRPEELFDYSTGKLKPELKELAPVGHRRMSANLHANGGLLRKDLKLPDFRDYAVEIPVPGTVEVENTGLMGIFLRDVMRNNMTNFRVFGPDETASNRLSALYEVTKKTWLADTLPEDLDGSQLSPDGRVMEMLSEHTLVGWLEGYLLTGRHGLFHTYEAFAHVIDSMFNQHAKWLDICKNDVHWRASVSSWNLLLSSVVWRQDHNGFSHQDPGFIDIVTNKSADVVRVYLPPDGNCLLSVINHCLKSKDYTNIIVADKQKHLQYLSIEDAIKHCTKGIGIWDWASNDDQGNEPDIPDVVMACCGDILTKESLAATAILRKEFPELKIRFINVVDLFTLTPANEHPHGLTDRDFDSLFTPDKPVIFNFHGYPWLIHKLTYRRTNQRRIWVRGYKEEGNINTPMGLAIHNQVDRFNLVIDVIDSVPKLSSAAAHVKERMKNAIIENLDYAFTHGNDKDEIVHWKWPESYFRTVLNNMESDIYIYEQSIKPFQSSSIDFENWEPKNFKEWLKQDSFGNSLKCDKIEQVNLEQLAINTFNSWKRLPKKSRRQAWREREIAGAIVRARIQYEWEQKIPGFISTGVSKFKGKLCIVLSIDKEELEASNLELEDLNIPEKLNVPSIIPDEQDNSSVLVIPEIESYDSMPYSQESLLTKDLVLTELPLEVLQSGISVYCKKNEEDLTQRTGTLTAIVFREQNEQEAPAGNAKPLALLLSAHHLVNRDNSLLFNRLGNLVGDFYHLKDYKVQYLNEELMKIAANLDASVIKIRDLDKFEFNHRMIYPNILPAECIYPLKGTPVQMYGSQSKHLLGIVEKTHHWGLGPSGVLENYVPCVTVNFLQSVKNESGNNLALPKLGDSGSLLVSGHHFNLNLTEHNDGKIYIKELPTTSNLDPNVCALIGLLSTGPNPDKRIRSSVIYFRSMLTILTCLKLKIKVR